MSDQQMTDSVELAVRQEIAQIVNWSPETTLAEIENQLGALYGTAQQVGDESTMQIVNYTWNQVQLLAEQGAGLLDIAAAAKESLQEAIEQKESLIDAVEKVKADLESVEEERDDLLGERDYAYEQLTDLKEDLQNPWGSSRIEIAAMVEMIEESAYEAFSDNFDPSEYEDEAYDQLWQNTVENLTDIKVGKDKADKFTDIILNDYYMSKLTDAQRSELRDFIERFIILEEPKS